MGVLISVAGAFVMVLISDPERQDFSLTGSPVTGTRYIRCVMVGIGVLGFAASTLLMVSNLLDTNYNDCIQIENMH